MSTTCLFCKIINKQIPSYLVYEDEQTLAFLDIMPVSKGHTLVISKEHSTNLLTTGDNALKSVITTIKKVALLLQDKLQVENFNLISNNGPLAGQSIDHFHCHIIPKYDAHSGLNLPLSQPIADSLDLENLVFQLKGK